VIHVSAIAAAPKAAMPTSTVGRGPRRSKTFPMTAMKQAPRRQSTVTAEATTLVGQPWRSTSSAMNTPMP
jgi:hypothetical protein